MFKRGVICAGVLVLAACSSEPVDTTPTVMVEDAVPSGDASDDEVRSATYASLDSVMNLAHEVVDDEWNLAVSPASLSYSLAIASEGATCEASEEILEFTGGDAETYRHLAAMLGEDSPDYRTRLTGLVLQDEDGGADSEALSGVAESFDTSYASVPRQDMTSVADEWLDLTTDGSMTRIDSPLSIGADAAVLTATHYESAWTTDVSVSTEQFQFADGRLELIPALNFQGVQAWQVERGTIIQLPTISPHPTYAFYPNSGVALEDLSADDWQLEGDPAVAAVVMPSVNVESSIDIDTVRTSAGLDGLGAGGECGLAGFGEDTSIDFGSQHAGYRINADGISRRPDIDTPAQTRGVTETPAATVTIDRPFALLTVDGETGWAITYAIINDPTRPR